MSARVRTFETNGITVVRTTSTGSRRLSPMWRNLAIGATLAVVVIVGVVLLLSPGTPTPTPSPVPSPPAAAGGAALYVDPAGSDGADGTQAAPLRSIQAALDRAEPGTTINLAPGEYREQPVTMRAGEPGAPITIRGPETGQDRAGRYQATLYGTGRVFSIDHSNYTLEGFTIDGQEELADRQPPADVSAITAFKDSVREQVADGRLIYIGASEESRDITGVTIRNMFLSGAGGECIRLRNNAHDNVIADSVIQYCGMFGKKEDDGGRFEYHNGEGVYIGTSPKSDDQPMYENDTSNGNRVTGNIIRTFGSECFNVKENAYDNVFEGNTCSGNTESSEFDGSNIELRGHDNVVRNNTISDSAGYAIKIKSDDEKYDKGGNVVEGNQISRITAEAFMVESDARQGQLCGNQVDSARVTDEDGPQGVDQPC